MLFSPCLMSQAGITLYVCLYFFDWPVDRLLCSFVDLCLILLQL
ncbi:hypothetical protein XF_2683 [Xylella fastidiosa 9a5c]|uniref:Uncharacterized protein n=1 Tax=Xylella fastidiosa (strain 9a5c) TaxID=160492 RepID=Q9PA37_XYLFA|nr:hypothetical protein XF_2683 [Xylella fastidiosa 9a5c]